MSAITITLKEYLDIKADLLPDIIKSFPVFKQGSVSLGFEDMFMKRNLWKEIGCETVEMFTYYLDKVLTECYTIYAPKMQTYIDNYKKLMKRKVKENYEDIDTDYVNPITAQKTENLVTATVTKNKGYRQRMLSFRKDNTEMLKSVLSLKGVYEDALAYCDKLFLGVL